MADVSGALPSKWKLARPKLTPTVASQDVSILANGVVGGAMPVLFGTPFQINAEVPRRRRRERTRCVCNRRTGLTTAQGRIGRGFQGSFLSEILRWGR